MSEERSEAARLERANKAAEAEEAAASERSDKVAQLVFLGLTVLVVAFGLIFGYFLLRARGWPSPS